MLVAGTLCAAQHWRDYGYVATLAKDWRVINVDPLGHGASDTPHDADSYEAAGVTADLVAVLDAEGIDPRPCGVIRVAAGSHATWQAAMRIEWTASWSPPTRCTRMKRRPAGC